jgi:hypothetical protein
VVTNALRLRGFKRPASAEAIVHPPLRERVGEYAYLVGIALVALAAGAAALYFARSEEHSGASMDRSGQMAVSEISKQVYVTYDKSTVDLDRLNQILQDEHYPV